MPTRYLKRHLKGKKYEKLAAEYLLANGCEIVATNFRFGRNEIDIICSKNGELIFVEVKGGRSETFGDPIYRIDERKRESIVKVAEAFIQKSVIAYQSYRFDVVIVKEREEGTEIEHLPAAFTA